MSNRPTTILEELLSAGRGVIALVTGDRGAARYFDFTERGLVGSFIAFLSATAFSAYVPLLAGATAREAGGSITRLLVMALFLFAMQLAFSALLLRQLKRLDGFLPYLVADNWATFFVTMISSLIGLFGLTGDAVLVIVGIMVLVIEVNIARLIITLKPWHVVSFLAAQLIGVSVGLMIIGVALPLPPDAAPAVTGLS